MKKRFRVRESIALAALAIGTLPVAQAAEQDIEELIVTARGVEESVRNIPVAVSVIGEEQLENFDLASFEDVASSTPNLDIIRAGSGSGASISIRGIGSSSTSIGIEQSVAVVLDGVYYPQGRVINEGLFDVRQVAVLKGPQALFFGKNATAGVVAIDTNGPGKELEFIGSMGYEIEQEARTYEAIFSGPLSETLGARLAIRHTSNHDGFMANAAGPTVYNTLDAATFNRTAHANAAPEKNYWSGDDSTFVRLTLEWTPNDLLKFSLKGSNSEYEINSPTGGTELWSCPTLNGQPHAVAGGLPVPNTQAECRADRTKSENPIPRTISRTNPLLDTFGGELGEDYESYAFTFRTDVTLDNADVVAIVNYHDQETNWVGDFDGGGSTGIFAGENNTFDNLSVEVQASTRFDFPVNLVGGVYYQETNRTFDQDVIFAGAENSAALDPTDRFTAYEKYSETEGQTWSAYLEARWDIMETLQLTAGARYIDEEKNSFYDQPYVNPFFLGLFTRGEISTGQGFDEIVPEATLRWEATDDITFYVAYKEGFKSGGFSNSGILGAISGTIEDFTFDPEEVKGWEGGVKARFLEGQLQVELNVYTYEFENLQIDFFNSPSFAFITENAGGSDTDGVELSVNWAPDRVEGLTIRGALAYNKAEYTDFIAPCYAGQRPAQGCTIFNPGQVPKQQLAGTERALAPEYAGFIGVDYTRPLGSWLVGGISVNYQYKDDHRLSAFGNPFDVQESYDTIDLSIRLASQDGKYQLALIGRNIADEYALLSSGDTPSTGGGTGTATGFVADRSGTPIAGESWQLQGTVRF